MNSQSSSVKPAAGAAGARVVRKSRICTDGEFVAPGARVCMGAGVYLPDV